MSESRDTLRWRGFKNALTKKKTIDAGGDSKLLKFLSTLDLTFLSIGSTLGVGVYVLAGDVARYYAGPAVVVSFLIAAIASLFAGLCFAEFGSRVPKAGSSYVYTYVTIGEFLAFIIGWALILEYVIGAASVARGLSGHIDEFNNQSISNAFRSVVTIEIKYISPYIDFLAFGITVVFSVALSLGAKESSTANNICTMINLTIVIFVVTSGLFKADIANWKISKEELPKTEGVDYGTGGFAPYGVLGIISGAGECFYGFIGFDCIATAGEEAKNPKKSLPIAIVASLVVVFFAYFGISAILTTVLPYYDQNTKAPFIYMFQSISWNWATYIVSVGAVCGLTTSLVGALFPLPRIIYAMASDGLLYKWLGNIHSRFQTPMGGTLIAGVFTGTLAAFFDVGQLSKMMSLGTLFSYSIVAACVLILRYKHDEVPENHLVELEEPLRVKNITQRLINANNLAFPTKRTSKIVSYLVTIYVIVSLLSAGFIRKFGNNIINREAWAIIVITILILAMVTPLVCINAQPRSRKDIPFSVPLVPFLPATSIFINFNLMWGLAAITWAQFAGWMVIGLIIYFTYGIKNSIHKGKPAANLEKAENHCVK
ncbi:cationic amino acid transporter 2-like [Leguminivora glycinivorella]|uniref:cationic amino acid transporter 2-like n=1 Tax=Leguminivora glycinivorella TaxID=1035111 RepID=UPI0020107889|nr:cationic amino acid transporter 2-like [Leguminivora glycinivorella]